MDHHRVRLGADRRLQEHRREACTRRRGCGHWDDDVPAPGATTSGVPQPGVSGTAGGPYSAAALRDPNNILSKRSIYFDFDDYSIKDQYRPIIEAHAKYLQANRNARATLQGHTDERGTREYNIALGQRRADAVKKLMVLLGAQEIQIETVSFGKRSRAVKATTRHRGRRTAASTSCMPGSEE
jgi:peptidoglycan-associated lipoprotein